ncbi:MAG: polysaccharide deacetylase family protein [Chitinophagaceae bacterium]|nr:polysaccharide deacetylase family protein [Chitinophagaceae bacterium]
MYYADPADEGEPSSGYFYGYSIPFLFISILFLSCQEKRKNEIVNQPVVLRDTSRLKQKKPSPVAIKPKKKKKKIYLTFDDGPNKGTKNVLDIVQQEEVPVTFFIVGEHVFASPGQSQVWDSLKMAKNIELCNHSYTHAHNRYNKFYQQPDSVVNDIMRTREELLPETNIVRTPGRNTWRIDSLHFTDIKKSKAAVDSLQQAGFIVFGWDLEWHYDHKTLQVKNTADEMLTQVDSMFSRGKTKVKDNLVILAHDQVYHKSGDSMQLRDFIQKLKKKDDYELALVSSYPGIMKGMIDSVRTAPQ